jgi:hypothetical protein
MKSPSASHLFESVLNVPGWLGLTKKVYNWTYPYCITLLHYNGGYYKGIQQSEMEKRKEIDSMSFFYWLI